jgi:proline iminopeptidase
LFFTTSCNKTETTQKTKTSPTYEIIKKKSTFKNLNVKYAKLDTGSTLGYFHFDNKGNNNIPLIMLHGGPGGGVSKQTLEIGDYLYEKNIDVYSFDQAGVGWSKNIPAHQYTVDRMVEDLEAFRKYLKLDKINIYGKSWGGTYALAYVVKYPENVNKIILINSDHYGKNKIESDPEPTNQRKGELSFKDDAPLERIQGLLQSIDTIGIEETEKDFSQDEFKYIFTKYINLKSTINLSHCLDNQLGENDDFDDDYLKSSNFNIYSNMGISNDSKTLQASDLNDIKNKVLFFKGSCDYIPQYVLSDFQRRIKNFTTINVQGRGHAIFINFDGENKNLNKIVTFIKD